jgi:hypothetical protein
VEAYRARNGLAQCHNCQQFGHVWANWKQPPGCLYCRGCHLHKECPEKGNTSSIPTCCYRRLAEGDNPHPANYRDWRHAKGEMQRKKWQRIPRITTGRVCGLVVRVPSYRSRGPGSIPGATRFFSEK